MVTASSVALGNSPPKITLALCASVSGVSVSASGPAHWVICTGNDTISTA